MIRVVLDGLVKRVDRVAIVDGVTLDVPPGELTYVLGPAGAGKTMLARLIAGLEVPDEGEVELDGRNVTGVAPRDRRVGLLFQDDSLWPQLSVVENVGYGLKLRGVGARERRRRVGEVLAAAGIESLADRRTSELTPLQRRRASLARSLALEPSLMIFDEPLGPLDPRDRAEFQEQIRHLHAQGEITLLVLTGDPREALAEADRLAVMDLGRIVQVGSPAELYNRPADAFVAQLLGPSNLLQGQLERSDVRGEAVVRTPIGRLVGQAPVAELPPGAPVTVLIRPDALVLGPSSTLGANRFLATVERQSFLGEVRRIELRGPGDWPVTALALQSQSRGLREGQSLTVSVPPDSVVVLASKFAAAAT